jgi:hypothetical protein
MDIIVLKQAVDEGTRTLFKNGEPSKQRQTVICHDG